MDTTPLWLAEAGPTYPALQGDLKTEVLVIGGGITGVTAAYLLKRCGRKVVLLERGTIATGETALNQASPGS